MMTKGGRELPSEERENTESGDYVEFRPSVRRWLLVESCRQATFLSCCALGIAIAHLLRDSSGAPLGFQRILAVAMVLAVCVAVTVGVSYRRCTRHFNVKVSAHQVRGPTPPLTYSFQPSKGTILLSQLDRARSVQRSRLDRLVGRQVLHSTTGSSIAIARRYFEDSELRSLSAMLGLDD